MPTSDNFLDIHNDDINPVTLLNRHEMCSLEKFFFMWVLDMAVLCLHSSTIVMSSCVHSDVLAEEDDSVDLKWWVTPLVHGSASKHSSWCKNTVNYYIRFM